MSLAVITAFGLGFNGCESSSSNPTNNNDDDITQAIVIKGQFIDSQVQGIEYSTPTQNGVTDKNGNFKYKNGETVTFKIGGIKLGSTKAKDIITPINILGVTNAQSINAVNMLILLQSLDSDKNTSNGIEISSTTLDNSKTMDIDFTQSSPININSTLTQLGLSSSDIKSEVDAKKHFTETILSTYKSSNDILTTDYLNGKTFYTENFVDSSGNYHYRSSIISFTTKGYTVKEHNEGESWKEMGEDYTISDNSIVGRHTNAKLVKIKDDRIIVLESYGYPENWGAQVEEYWLNKPSGFPTE
jgi:hypothetical protein